MPTLTYSFIPSWTGSPWRDQISLAILNLQEKGMIQSLYNKWWRSAGTTCSRDDKNKEAKASALGFDNIGGVFVVLLAGLMSAVAIACIEFCWYAKVRDKIGCSRLPSEFASEAKLAFNCMGSHKKARNIMPGSTAIPRFCNECTKCGTRSSPVHHMSTYVPSDHMMSPSYHHPHHHHHHLQHHHHHEQELRRTSSPDRGNVSPIPPPPPPSTSIPPIEDQIKSEGRASYLPMMEMTPQTTFECPDCLYRVPDLHPGNHVSPSLRRRGEHAPPESPVHQHRSPHHQHHHHVHPSDTFDNDLISSSCNPIGSKHSIDHHHPGQRRYHT